MINFEKDEKVIYTARKHWFVFVLETSFILIFALFPILFYHLSGLYFKESLVSLSVLYYGYSLWIILLWLVFVYIWTDFFLDVWFVTDKRIIDVDQKGLFHRETSSFRLDLIQDVTIEVPGILATLIGYGHIHVQTAGSKREFLMKGVSNPKKLKEKIMEEHNRARENLQKVWTENPPDRELK
ncbi:MAG: hypothetical protein COV70_03640 [Parcubacteria group bacterium CG11_big_fil_rev_8_21_14_0_20_39_22]|nr:MAG: hypothetical protein COV70_03640 [Parcubacteria group bacterium CG11_big_fil_rev_8_21_14_0_20_39_22]